MNFDPTGWEQDPVDYGCWDIPYTATVNIPEDTSERKFSRPLGEDIFKDGGNVGDFDKSQVCFYGEKCRRRDCNRIHLDDVHTPCLYGPECKKAGCLKIHLSRFDEKCYYDEECKLPWCRYIHTNDKCSRGRKCNVDGCKYAHPKS
jgi:hypothetical protein